MRYFSLGLLVIGLVCLPVGGIQAGAHFLRGDANSDTGIDISDAVFTLTYLFSGGGEPTCKDAADADRIQPPREVRGHALKHRVVLAVDGQNDGAARFRRVHEQFARDHQRLLVRQQQPFPGANRRQEPSPKRTAPAKPAPVKSGPAGAAGAPAPRPRRRASGRPAETMRIAKAMARAGPCSRRHAEPWIADGRVKVNGETITSPALDVTPKDRVLVDGAPRRNLIAPQENGVDWGQEEWHRVRLVRDVDAGGRR